MKATAEAVPRSSCKDDTAHTGGATHDRFCDSRRAQSCYPGGCLSEPGPSKDLYATAQALLRQHWPPGELSSGVASASSTQLCTGGALRVGAALREERERKLNGGKWAGRKLEVATFVPLFPPLSSHSYTRELSYGHVASVKEGTKPTTFSFEVPVKRGRPSHLPYCSVQEPIVRH